MAKNSILAIEDDSAIRTVLGLALKSAGYTEVEFAGDGLAGLEMAVSNPPRLVILDLMLPGMSGFEVCRRLRANAATRNVPVVVVSALGEERDVVKGLECGADDYVTKPFSPSVLLARVKAVLRRTGENAEPELAIDGLVLDRQAHSVTLAGREIALTPTEYGVLELLMSRPDRVYTRSQIIDAVQGCGKCVTDRTVDVQLVGLRRKLGAWAAHIESVRAVGYRLNSRKESES